MKNPLQISYHDLKNNKTIEETIHEKYEKLLAATLDITKCHVVLEKLSKHHHKANTCCVRLDLKVSHVDDIVVTEKCTEEVVSIKSAIIKIFKQALIELREHLKHRKEVKRDPRKKQLEFATEETEE